MRSASPFRPSSVLYAGLRTVGLPALARRFRDAGVVLCYHNVVADDVPAAAGDPGLHMPVERFRRQMRWLASHYDVVPLRHFVDKVTAVGTPLRRTAAVTFDDGYAGVFRCAWPVLQHFGIPATVFVVTQTGAPSGRFWWDHAAARRVAGLPRRERWLRELRGDGRAILAELAPVAADRAPDFLEAADWGLLRSAAGSGIDLGVHSATHRSLPTLSDEELVDEVITSRHALEGVTGVVPEFFAYPYGLWDERVRKAVRAAGYRAAFTLDYGLNLPRADPWALRRVNVPAGIGDPAFQAWTSGFNLRWTRHP